MAPFKRCPPPCGFRSDSGADATLASSSNDSHYSGSRVETPVSYMGDEDDEDVDVTTTAAAVASISGGPQLMGAQLKQELELDGDGLASMQFFVVGGQTHLKCVHLYRKHFVYGYNDVAM